MIKDHLETQQIELVKRLEHIKLNVKGEIALLNSDAEKTNKEVAHFSENLSKLLLDFDSNQELIKKNAYECQEFINDLNDMNQRYRNVLRNVIFEPSTWLPDEKFIYPSIEKFTIIK